MPSESTRSESDAWIPAILSARGRGQGWDTTNRHAPWFCYHDVTMRRRKAQEMVGMTGFEPATP